MAHVDKDQTRKHAQFTSHPGSSHGVAPEHETERTHPLVHDNTGLSPWYRFLWRLKYIGFDIYSTASRQPGINPREQLRRDRAQKVAQAYRARGEQPPTSVRHATGLDT